MCSLHNNKNNNKNNDDNGDNDDDNDDNGALCTVHNDNNDNDTVEKKLIMVHCGERRHFIFWWVPITRWFHLRKYMAEIEE